MPERRTSTLVAVAAAMFYPTLLTWIYFVVLHQQASSTQQTVFGIGKLIQFAFPAFWVLAILREKPKFSRPHRVGLVWGTAFGAAVLVLMVALYHVAFKPWGVFDTATAAVRAKVSGFGITQVWQFVLLGVFYSLCHSLMEEYYWRWFVFRKLREFTQMWPAALISGGTFAMHHVILLGTFFGWANLWPYLFSVCVAIGGVVWAWIYEKSGSLVGAWVSHLLIDAGIFIVGYDLL